MVDELGDRSAQRPASGKKLLIHVGTGKTGSSSIQYTLRRADRRGYLKPVHYPNLFNKVHHEALTTLYKPFKGVPRAVRSLFSGNEQEYPAHVEQYRAAFKDALASHDKLVLSSEHLYTIDDAAVASLSELLREQGFDSVKILLYLREPASFFLSQAQQRVKASSRLPDPNTRMTRYSTYVKRWRSHFEDVEVREFSTEALTGGDVVHDFMEVLNRYFDVNINIPEKLIERVNDSLSTEGMALVRQFREQFYTKADNDLNKPTTELIRMIQRCESEGLALNKPRLKPAVVALVNRNHREEVDRLRAELGEAFFPRFESNDGAEDDIEFSNRVGDILELDPGFDERLQRLSLCVIKRLLD